VDRELAWLTARVAGGVERASSFPDLATAEHAVAEVLAARADDVQAWVASGSALKRPFDADLAWPTGVLVEQNGVVATTTGARVVLQRASSAPGWFILTAFPR
jgi:hypothetical protein